MCGFSAVAGIHPEPVIVPAVQQWHDSEGACDVRGAPIVIAAGDEKILRPTAEVTCDDFVALGFPRPEILVGEKPAGRTSIVCVLTQTPFNAGTNVIEEQAYSVEISAGGVVIAAHNRAGIFSGTRSVLQMLKAGNSLPCGKIVDGPVTRYRMLMLDVGRKAFPIETLYDYLRMLGWFRMNVLHLHLSDGSFDNRYGGFRVQCDTFPGLTSKDCFYTKRQLREFQNRAAAMGIMVLPEIDMPGHATPFTLLWPELARSPGNLEVNNPQAIERMKQILDEIVPLFDAPYFHIGTDEYRVPYQNAEDRARTGDAFRQFINTMNAHIRAKGRECVVWDGWEHVKSDIEIDPTVVVDMWWGVFDTADYLKRGHKVFNSNQNVSYLTTGRPVYGVNNARIYNNWQPNHFGKVNPPPGGPGVLGAKLHVWCGQGPSGWTMTEIADQVLPSVIAFSEKMWGRKASPDYQAFLERARQVENVPGLTVFNRIPSKNGGVLDLPDEITVATAPALPLETSSRHDLEFPWTLTMEVRKTAANGRGVILSSGRAELCDSYKWDERKKVTNPGMKEKVSTVTHTGFGVVRAAGNWGATPAEAKMAAENSRVYGDPLPLDKWVTVTVVATRLHTAVYFDGKLVGQQNQQTLCPLQRFGSTDAANSFAGSVRNLRVFDRALAENEIAAQHRN